ncbi:MAG TPA: NUDIX hydrolase [Xanthobacteraceae bacterium]|jgi:hypothetical protein
MDLPAVEHLDQVEITVEPWSWPLADARRAEIDAHFADLKRRRSVLWNGRALMLKSYAVDNRILRATAFETDYASLCAWRDFMSPDPPVLNFFAPAAIRAFDGAYVLGEMACYTAGAGHVTFPCGTPALEDVRGQSVDLMGHIRREIAEETGINPDELECEPGWSVVRGPNHLALMKRFFSSQTADELRSRIEGYLDTQVQPELSSVRVVRRPADFCPGMANFTIAFLHECLHGRLSAQESGPDGD